MPDPATTALQRFVQGRGRDYLEFETLKKKTLKMAAVSWLIVPVFPAAIYGSAILAEGQSSLVRVVIEFGAIFGSYIVLSRIAERQTRRTLRGAMGERTDPITLSNGAQVTPEAQGMAMMLTWKYRNSNTLWAERQKKSHEFARKHKRQAAFLGIKKVIEIQSESEKALADLPQSVSAGMEQAAAQYERCLRLSRAVPESMEAVQAVADASMVAALTWAHRIAKSPESLSADEPRLWAAADNLRELADNLDALTSHAGITPTLGIQDLLDEFRRRPAVL